LQLYYAYNFVSVMGCVDQYMIRNPNTRQTSPPSGRLALLDVVENLGFNTVQYVTAQRLLLSFQTADIYSSVFGSGPSALKASDKILNFASDDLPYGQWRTEVEGWFQISLAKMQQYAVDYAYNTADVGQYGYVVLPEGNDSSVQAAWQAQCRKQKIRNTGSFQTFSFLGLMIILFIGLLIIGMAVGLKHCVSCYRGRNKKSALEVQNSRECAHFADGKFQLQRMVFEKIENGPYRNWNRRDKEYPWCMTENGNPLIARLEEVRPREGPRKDAVVYQAMSPPLESMPRVAAHQSPDSPMKSMRPNGAPGDDKSVVRPRPPPSEPESRVEPKPTPVSQTEEPPGKC